MLRPRIKETKTLEVRVYRALHSDIREGYVWLPFGTVSSGSVVELVNPASGKRVWVDALQIDENFLDEYAEGRRTSHSLDSQNCVVISHWYRTKLGIEGQSSDAKIKLIVNVPRSESGAAKLAAKDHPQSGMRVSMKLAKWGLNLGLIGLLIGLISVFISCHLSPFKSDLKPLASAIAELGQKIDASTKSRANIPAQAGVKTEKNPSDPSR